MSKDIFEGSTLNLKATFKKGTPKGADVTFTIKGKGDKFPETKTAKVESGLGGKFAQLKDYLVPDVPEGEDNYTLEYTAKADDQEFTGSKFTVWPHKIEFEVVNKDKPSEKWAAFPFQIKQERKAVVKSVTDSAGKYTCQLKNKATFEVEAIPPYSVEWDAPNKGRKRKGKVSRTFAAEFLEPVAETQGEPIQQFVNLKSKQDGQDGFGNVVTIEVGAKDNMGIQGDLIYIQVKFGRESKRNKPLPQLLDADDITADTDKKIYKGTVKLGKKGAPAKFKVNLGLAGGDTCEIKIASTTAGRDGAGDATLKFVNWRKLYYELRYPTAMKKKLLEADLNGKKAMDLPAALKGKVKDKLDPAFISYDLVGSHEFDKPPKGSVLPATFVKGTGDPVFVLTPYTKEKLPSKFKSTDTRCIHVSLCDRSFAAAGPRTTQQPILDAATKDHPAPTGLNFFEFLCMEKGASIDVSGCIWEVQGITSVSHPDHPGLDENGDPRTGAVLPEWIKIKDYETVTITLPATSVPGKLAGAVSATKCPILVEFKIEEAFEINGSAGDGKQMLVLKPDDKAGLNAETVCHELGHSMGMAIFPGRSNKSPGMEDIKHVDEGGAAYSNPWNGQTVGANGFRSGHTGKHCAEGVSDKTKTTFFDAGGTCLMFGEGKLTESRAAFCATCLAHAQARNLVDIRTDWSERSTDES